MCFVSYKIEGRLREYLSVYHSPFNYDGHPKSMDALRVLFEYESNV